MADAFDNENAGSKQDHVSEHKKQIVSEANVKDADGTSTGREARDEKQNRMDSAWVSEVKSIIRALREEDAIDGEQNSKRGPGSGRDESYKANLAKEVKADEKGGKEKAPEQVQFVFPVWHRHQ